MLSSKYINALKAMETGDTLVLRSEIIEYILRYLEINAGTILKKYKAYYGDSWDIEFAKTVNHIYYFLAITKDVRFLNVLLKFRKLIKKHHFQYEGKALDILFERELNIMCK